jgi:hypothetical protein
MPRFPSRGSWAHGDRARRRSERGQPTWSRPSRTTSGSTSRAPPTPRRVARWRSVHSSRWHDGRERVGRATWSPSEPEAGARWRDAGQRHHTSR